ncbi:MAG: polyhydroxyalkanoate depolymerase [Caulobacteraceae bacterium]
MLYALSEMAYNAVTPARWAARMTRDFWHAPYNPAADTPMGRTIYAAADLFTNLTRRYGKPDWRIDSVEIDGTPVRVRQAVDWSSPWCKLVHFARYRTDLRRAGRHTMQPAVLIVAPMSGHYATLLRGTVETFLQDHDVYVTDWVNAREVPVLDGRFDFYDFIDHIREMLRALGPSTHVVAVCQPGPCVLAAAALMAEDNEDARPASMTFMGSPIDARLAPTVPTILAEERPFAWFKSNLIYTVPPPYPGAMRRVYPGMVQLMGFMSMNAERHQQAHQKYFEDLVGADGDSAAKHLEFYDEYLSVMDLTEEFYLQTIDVVFQSHLLPRGELVHHDGRKVNLGAITDIGLMTVEGEKDDISGVGQTQAAHTLCSGLPDAKKELYVQPRVGHYGVFNGRRFREEIYPRVREFIHQNEVR